MSLGISAVARPFYNGHVGNEKDAEYMHGPRVLCHIHSSKPGTITDRGFVVIP